MNKNVIKRKFLAFLKDIIPVIVGILIALWLNNWNENRQDRLYIKKVYSAVQQDLYDSSVDITLNLQRHQAYVDTLRAHLENSSVSIMDITTKSKGIYLPAIKISTLKAAAVSRPDLVDYQKLAALADMEEQKEILSSKSDRLTDFVYSQSYETSKDKKEMLAILMADLMGTEKALQEIIENFNK